MALPQTYKVLQAEGLDQPPKIIEKSIEKPGKDQVLVKIAFSPINPAEIAVIAGRYPGSVAPAARPVGWEGSGIIAALGEDLKASHKVGDRVHVTASGTMSEYLLTNSESCTPVLQDDLSLEDAASHYINPATAYYFGEVVKREGHKAAIHTAGSSALGRMMIRYFKHIGVPLINVVRRDDVIEELLKDGADYVLNMNAPDFKAKFKELIEKEKATIAFEAICGDFTDLVVKCLPPNSRIYITGLLQGPVIKNLDTSALFQGKMLGGLFLYNYVDEVKQKGELDKFYTAVHSLLPKVLNSHIQKVFKLEEVNEALAYYKENSSKGKILISF